MIEQEKPITSHANQIFRMLVLLVSDFFYGCAGLLAIENGTASGNPFAWSLVGGAIILSAVCIFAADLVKSWPRSQ